VLVCSRNRRWAKDLGVVVNLESMGAGGRLHVFQCNSARVASLIGTALEGQVKQRGVPCLDLPVCLAWDVTVGSK